MIDQRMKKLAGNLVNYSCKVKPGDNVLIEATDRKNQRITPTQQI